jgi:flagellar biogenesis protein FliO
VATDPLSSWPQTAALWLVLALVAALALAWAQRRGLGRSSGPLEVLGRLSLEPRRSLYLVRVAERVWLLSSSEAGLTSLAELRSDEVGGLLAGRGEGPTQGRP